MVVWVSKKDKRREQDMQYFYYESYTSWIYHDKLSMMFFVGIYIRQDNIFICSLIPGYINFFLNDSNYTMIYQMFLVGI